jgi:23S rRNA (guanosine2251-2'-O)-methyltransferase
MSASSFVADEAQQGGTFYWCYLPQGCGLRFPVALNDPFDGRCPRCGRAVRLVAQISGPALSTAENSKLVPPSNLCLLLDNWRSLFNVGSAFRSADGAGVRHLYLCGITGRPDEQRKLAKTALGAEQAVSWSYHANAVEVAAELQNQGAKLWVLERSAGSVSLFDINEMPQEPVILAAGNEVVGVDPGLVEMADKVIHLPMMGSKRSLNVAVALSIAIYWLRAREVASEAHQPSYSVT